MPFIGKFVGHVSRGVCFARVDVTSVQLSRSSILINPTQNRSVSRRCLRVQGRVRLVLLCPIWHRSVLNVNDPGPYA